MHPPCMLVAPDKHSWLIPHRSLCHHSISLLSPCSQVSFVCCRAKTDAFVEGLRKEYSSRHRHNKQTDSSHVSLSGSTLASPDHDCTDSRQAIHHQTSRPSQTYQHICSYHAVQQQQQQQQQQQDHKQPSLSAGLQHAYVRHQISEVKSAEQQSTLAHQMASQVSLFVDLSILAHRWLSPSTLEAHGPCKVQCLQAILQCMIHSFAVQNMRQLRVWQPSLSLWQQHIC